MSRAVVAAMLMALASASPGGRRDAGAVPQWVDDLAAANSDRSPVGIMEFAVSTAHSLLRSGWQGQHMRNVGTPLLRFSPRRRGWIRLDVKSTQPPL